MARRRRARIVMVAGVSAGLAATLAGGCSRGGASGPGRAESPPGSTVPATTTPAPSADAPTAVASTAATATAVPVSSPGTASIPAAGPSALWGKEYRGTADITVDVYDYCTADGSRQLTDTKKYAMKATLDLTRPRSGGGQTEANPFSLLLAVGQPSEAGAVSFWSAAVSTASSQDLAGNPRDPHLLLTYWNLKWDDGRLSGRLTDAHTEQGVTLNLLNWPSPVVPCRSDLGDLPGGYPHAVAKGTTLDGGVDGSGADLTAQGTTGDGQLEFRFEFTGNAS